MIQRMISLALEFFEFAVMRRPDHKFRDQWRKADSALQPPSSSYFGHIFWLLVLLLSSFSLQKWPITFKIYRYIYLLNISLCVYYHDFRSVIVFLLQLYKLYLYLCIFHVYLHLHLFLSLDRLWSIAPVFQDLIARESTGEEIFFIQSTTWWWKVSTSNT